MRSVPITSIGRRPHLSILGKCSALDKRSSIEKKGNLLNDGRDGKSDIEDVLDGVGDEIATGARETSTLENIDNVVPGVV